MRTNRRLPKPPRLRPVDLRLGYWKDGYWWHPQVNTRKHYLLKLESCGLEYCAGKFTRCWNRGGLRFPWGDSGICLADVVAIWEIVR